MSVRNRIFWMMLLFFLLTPTVNGHIPFGSDGENNSLEDSVDFSEPTKSWTLYRELHEVKEADYYKLHLKPGEKFHFSISTPRSEDPGFVPNAVVIWPREVKSGDVPDFVKVPLGYGAHLIEGVRPPQPIYEAFTPTSYYFVVEYSREVSAEGDYFFAVYDLDSGGRYNLAVGYVEEFTALEWLKIPFDVISIRIWEGQSLFLILTPLILTLLAGFSLLQTRYKIRNKPSIYVGLMAGLFYVGTGLMTTFQMFIAAIGAAGTHACMHV